ncbi:hypothetical protein HPB51_000184 [Rhipicephalus microplus]|uniref:Endonuclease/exonuclease/phosphatase domain-containing protein n=1 Tax=Rhipicephalus microplus TaxID=6941 RepID=A0A9J6D441_RHIMP|nr:hypothetical protein HPB51_000184 [Rhipicephalus microplus]
MQPEMADDSIPKRCSCSRRRSPSSGCSRSRQHSHSTGHSQYGGHSFSIGPSRSRCPGKKMTWAEMVRDSDFAPTTPTTSKQGSVVASCSPNKCSAINIQTDDDTSDVDDYVSDVSEAPSNGSASDNKARKHPQDEDSPTNLLKNFTKLLAPAVSRAKGRPLIVACIFNAHNNVWGFGTDDRKGLDIAECVDNFSLRLITNSRFPTRRGNSVQ